ncbi:hypothetical protein ACP4OV_006943 [Aristida adscensionis]
MAPKRPGQYDDHSTASSDSGPSQRRLLPRVRPRPMLGPRLQFNMSQRPFQNPLSWTAVGAPGMILGFAVPSSARRYVVVRDHFCPLVPWLEATANRARRKRFNKMKVAATKASISHEPHMDPVYGFPKEYIEMLKGRSVNIGDGPYVFRINGVVHHRIGSLIPPAE